VGQIVKRANNGRGYIHGSGYQYTNPKLLIAKQVGWFEENEPLEVLEAPEEEMVFVLEGSRGGTGPTNGLWHDAIVAKFVKVRGMFHINLHEVAELECWVCVNYIVPFS